MVQVRAQAGPEDEWRHAMEVLHFGNEFPKDDLQQTFRILLACSKSGRHALLAQFISNATRAVKGQIHRLPYEQRQLFPPVDSLSEWAAQKTLREGPLCGAVDGALLVLLQVCIYICHVETRPHEYHRLQHSHLTALGVGLFSAAALSLSSSVVDVVAYGVDAVVVAFCMGIHVGTISEHIESRDAETRETWAYVVHGVDPEEAQVELDSLHAKSLVADTNKLVISAVSRKSITVSGPPWRLKGLFQRSRIFRNATAIALPVYGGICHAPHIYGEEDIQSVVQKADGSLFSASRTSEHMSVALLHGTSEGRPYPPQAALDRFKCVIRELLTRPILWDNVVANVLDTSTTRVVESVRLHCFGNSGPFQDLKRAFDDQLSSDNVVISDYLSALREEDMTEQIPRGPAQAKLAVVGMSCRLPGATSTEEFWNLLEKGRDVSSRIPKDRFDIDTHYDPDGKDMNKPMTQFGCFIESPSLFDAPFFNMSPREAETVDPQMRLMLTTAYEALEQAGFVPDQIIKPERIGTFYGQSADDYREVNQGQEVETYYIPGGCRAFGPGRVNYFFKFAGPSYSIDTACSSGLAAIELACNSLWSGTVDMAVAGGVNILTNPDGFCGLGKGHFLTKGHHACKTWDATADGYCRADGVGSLVIKRLEDAQNDNILAVILATGTNHSADAVSITHPHAGHQSFLARQILSQAGVDPLDVSYVELHGTGTQAGDSEEMQGVLDVYAPNVAPRRRADQELYIGSCKANVGHGESVAGTTSLIKVLLMLQKRTIPPHIGIRTEINPRFPKDFEARRVRIPLSPTTWSGGQRKRIAAVNNFGAAGGNTMMILEEAPAVPESQAEDPRRTHVVTLSAKSKASLLGNINRLINYLDVSQAQINLANLGYTTTARRHHHNYRIACVASSVSEVRTQLVSHTDQISTMQPIKKSDPGSRSVVFAFTGQGASSTSMNLGLYQSDPVFRKQIKHLDTIARAQGFPSFLPALDGRCATGHQYSTVVAHLALVSTEIALANYWIALGITPDIVIGHSLGEYAALHVAGVISSSDAIFMVGRRAELLGKSCEANTHIMVAVQASVADIAEAASAHGRAYTVACVNGPRSTVLSGALGSLNAVITTLENAGYRCTKLDVAFAFHSDQMDPILDDYEAFCKDVFFQEPRLPVISPLLGKVVFDGRTFNASYLRRATREPVDFLSALQSAYNTATVCDNTFWIEVGPHAVCTSMIRSILPATENIMPSLRRSEDNWKTMSEALASLHVAGLTIRWHEFHRPFDCRLLDLPSYSWDEKSYWKQYNGNWCLTKGNTYYTGDLGSWTNGLAKVSRNEMLSSLVHNIVQLDVDGAAGGVVMQSDLMQKDFKAAAYGHRINNCGVVTSSIHADIAFTLSSYLYRNFYPAGEVPSMDMRDLRVTTALVAAKDSLTTERQIIQVSARTADIKSGVLDLTWQNVVSGGQLSDPFATAKVAFSSAATWLHAWSPLSHLITNRIETLERMALEGHASRLSGSLAYNLFATNLVDYAESYRGMQNVVMHDLEAFADVRLHSGADNATWTVPPHFIDSVAHLAGFVMNCTDNATIDVRSGFCVTPGWKSMRFAEPLEAGACYRSYVKMIPTPLDPTIYVGDVYVLRRDDHVIIGMVQGLEFRRYPRVLLDRFFSGPAAASSTIVRRHEASNTTTDDSRPLVMRTLDDDLTEDVRTASAPVPDSPRPTKSIALEALSIIAQETLIRVDTLTDDMEFAAAGIDSLMSLVVADKLQKKLGVEVKGSLFLDYPTIGDLRKWLCEYYG